LIPMSTSMSIAGHQPETFEGLFGQDPNAGIDFAARPRWSPAELLVDDNDNLNQIDDKIRHCADIVNHGHSLAVAMGRIVGNNDPYDYNTLAMDQMPPEELRQFQAYQRGVRFTTPLDPARDRKPWTRAGHETSKDANRLEALRRIFTNRDLTYANLQFFYEERSQFLPLLLALTRVVGVQKNTSLGGSRNPAELAEQSTATMLAAACSAHLNTIMATVNGLKQRIDSHRNVVAARAAAMRPKEGPGQQRRRVPENERRGVVGQEPVGPPVNWNRPGAEGRFQRLAENMADRMDDIVGSSNLRGRGRGGVRRRPTNKGGPAARKQPTRGGRVEKPKSPAYIPQSPTEMHIG